MVQIPELLAPAGGREQLTAAVENGADAVYLGGRLHNARQNAANFDDSELKSALEYAHVRGVNVYVTLNTLIDDSELAGVLEYANCVYEAGADALIVQDVGFAAAVRKQLPDLPIHMSTQATIYNLEGVKAAERLGASRIILARELSLEEIHEIKNKTSIELEMFVHGALCQGYSGQCYLSSMIGGRSGNRGNCAQPCRLPYTITKQAGDIHKSVSEKDYYLSPKDFCTVEHLDKLIGSGVRSLKIEGRMKSPEYVAIVTGIYRKYLDEYARGQGHACVDPKDLKRLKQIYNRGGFSTGYIFSNPGRELITRERSKHWGTYLGKVVGRNERKKYVDFLLDDNLSLGDGIEIVNRTLPGNLVTWMQKKQEKTQKGEKGEVVTVGYIDGIIKKGDAVYKISDRALNKEAARTFSGNIGKRVAVSGHLTVLEQKPLQLTLKDPLGNQVTVSSPFIPEPAINKPLTEEIARGQIEKTGSTPFIMKRCTVEIGPNLSVPLSELNAIRRKAIDDLTAIRRSRYPERKGGPIRMEPALAHLGPSMKAKTIVQAAPVISVFFHRWRSLSDLEGLGAGRIYLPILPEFKEEQIRIIQTMKEKGIQMYISIPPITKGDTDHTLRKEARHLGSLGIDGLLIGNICHIDLLAESELPMLGDYSLNICNSSSVKAAADLGLKGVTLSHELTLSQLKKIHGGEMELEATVYGRVPGMISEHCPIGSWISHMPESRKCSLCLKSNYFLKDRTGAEFPILGDPGSCRTLLLNKENLNMSESLKELELSAITSYRLYFYDETGDEMEKITDKFKFMAES